MSYKESVIIPFDVYKKCKFIDDEKQDKDEKKGDITNSWVKRDILKDDLPSDVKIKLYKQQKRLAKKRVEEPKVVKIENIKEETPSEDRILNEFPLASQPTVYIILKYIRESKGIISWNNEMEIILDGDTIQDSNIINLLRFVTNNLTVTSEKDIPTGARRFVSTLEKIGVPKLHIRVPRFGLRSQKWINI